MSTKWENSSDVIPKPGTFFIASRREDKNVFRMFRDDEGEFVLVTESDTLCSIGRIDEDFSDRFGKWIECPSSVFTVAED